MNSLKEQIISANKTYREGSPIIDDQTYDDLLEELESQMGMIEFECFKQTLTESKGTVKLEFVLGSLTKLKAENEGDLEKFIKKENIKELFVSEKLDGASVLCVYNNGTLIECSSRGDGSEGQSWLDKASHFLPTKIDYKEELHLRGELTLTNNDHVTLGYTNKRSGVCGILNSKTIEPHKLKYVTPFFYQILNSTDTIEDQFKVIFSIGFKTPRFKILSIES